MKWLLVDDHALFREGLALLIAHRLSTTERAIEVLEAGDLSQARDMLAAHPDVSLALLDLGLPDHQGLGTLAQWTAMAPQVPVVVLSADDRPEIILAAVDAGAAGFIPKTVHASTMQEALRCVLGGGVYLPAVSLMAYGALPVLDPQLGAAGAMQSLGLTDRQVDVLRLLIEGKANKDICRRLDLSESTVKTHLAAIFRKLNVNSRTQAVVAVAQAGIRLSQ